MFRHGCKSRRNVPRPPLKISQTTPAKCHMSTIYLSHKNNPQQSIPLQVIPTYAFPGFSSPSLLQFSSYLSSTFTHPIPRLGIANCRSLPPPAPGRESKTHFSLCDFHVFTEKLLRFFPRLWLYCPRIEIMKPK